LDAPAHLGGDLFQRRADLFARPAPLGPKIHQHRRAGLQHVGFETIV
jgi:hypothetical protein